jgi:hypothetical protein
MCINMQHNTIDGQHRRVHDRLSLVRTSRAYNRSKCPHAAVTS